MPGSWAVACAHPTAGTVIDTHVEGDAVAPADVRRDLKRWRGPAPATPGTPRPSGDSAAERQIASLLALCDGDDSTVAWAKTDQRVHVAMAMAFAPNFVVGQVTQNDKRPGGGKASKYDRPAGWGSKSRARKWGKRISESGPADAYRLWYISSLRGSC